MTTQPLDRCSDERPSANRAECAEAGIYKLIVLDIAADGAWPEEIRWEVWGAGEASLSSGNAESFDEAKRAAEKAWHQFQAPN